MELVRAIFGIFLLFAIDGSRKEKAWGCGLLIVALAVLGLAAFGVYKLFG